MRSWRLWVIQMVLLLGLGTALAQAADREDRGRAPRPPSESASTWDWMNPTKWFDSKEKEKPADAKKVSKKDAAKKADLPALPSAADEARSRRVREEAELRRRWEVIDELRAIALRRDDHVLLRQVEELERRAFAIYTQRCGAPALPAGAEAELSGLDSARDAEALLRRRPGEQPTYTVTTDRAKQRDAVKEVER